MSKVIAITGKGGVGKTTIGGLLVARLIANNCKPVLAVDADPNTCLDEVLGVKAEKSIGSVREEARTEAAKGLGAGISKQEMIEMKIAESLVEADDFDLIAMGRPEGPGCYCYANNVLKQAINTISSSYPYVVLDNEAGLENLSRRIVSEVDVFVMVADPSKRGIDTVKRLYELSIDMGVKYKKLAIIVNRLRTDELPEHALRLKETTPVDVLIGLQDNEEAALFAENGRSLIELPSSNGLVKKIDSFLKEIEIV